MSHLTPTQTTTLKTYILADPVLAPLTSGPGTDYGAIADALNVNASPAFVVWRTSVTREEIQNDDAFNWAQVDNLTSGSKYRIWDWMFGNSTGTINPSKANIRAGIAATWVGTAALLAVQAVVLARCKRNATRLEKLFATGVGSDASPGLLVFEGAIDLSHIASIFNA